MRFRHCWTVLSALALPLSLASSPSACAADADLTREQIVKLMQASQERCASFSATFRVARYALDASGSQRAPADTAQLSYARNRNRAVLHVRSTMPSGVGARADAYVSTPQWNKTYSCDADAATGSAVVALGPLRQFPYLDPFSALWRPTSASNWRNDALTLRALTRNEAGLYVMELFASQNNVAVRYEIDPARGYCPVRTEYLFPDGRLMFSIVCQELRDVGDGVFVPFKYIHTSGAETRAFYDVLSAACNTPLSDETLDYKFPEGTLVDDRIAGLRYTVREKSPTATTTSTLPPAARPPPALEAVTRPLAPSDLATPGPATDAELERTAAKAGLPSRRPSPDTPWHLFVLAALSGAFVVSAIILFRRRYLRKP